MEKEKIKRMLTILGVGTASITSTLALVPDNAPTRAVIAEVQTHRQIDSKTWIRDDGTLTSRISEGGTPVHFRENGLMREIDNSFVFDGLTRYKNQRNFFDVSIPKYFTSGQVAKIGDKQVSFVPIGANSVSPEIQDGDFNIMTQKYDKNVARFVEAWNGVDVEYRTKYYGLKESIIVKNELAPTSFSFRVERTGLNAPTFRQTGKALTFSDGIRNVIEVDNLIAHDAKNRNVPITKSWSAGILSLSFNPILEVTSTTTHRVAYPVTIDPTSRFNPQSGTETTSFDAWIDLCFTLDQSEANHRLDSANCTTTNNNDTTSLVTSVGFTGHAPPRPTGARAWMQFNTAGTITAGATINATASTSIGLVNSGAPTNSYNDGIDYIAITHATTSGPLPLQVSVADGDWKRVTGLFSNLQLLATSSQLDLANDDSNKGHDISSMANGEARTFILNATGRANIAIGGGTYATTTFGTCEGHDCEETAHGGAGDTNNTVTFSSAEGADPPILDVDWTAASVAVVPPEDVIFFNWINKTYAFFE